MFPYFAQERGLLSKNYYVDSFENQNCSAHELYLLEEFISNGTISNIVVLFDHNFGGGTNTYSKEIVEKNLHAGFNLIRVYHFDGRWLLEWHGSGDGLHFYSESLESVFNILNVKQVVKIVVNSLYGAPEYKALIHKIIALKNKNHLNLEIKIHDYLTICPSPHLLDSNGRYCGVPSKTEDCNKCINGLDEWYPSWVKAENRVQKIEVWRAPFRDLFEAADTVNTFDESSYEILSKAYKLNKSRIRVIPHEATHINFSEKIDLNGPLKIGVLGTLTKAKGIKKIRELAEYIEKNNLPAKIIVIGAADLRNTRVLSNHGAYEAKDLPILIKQNRINVIFCSSIIPETFGYTLSEAMALELPILCFDIGAQAARVRRYKNGKVIDLMSSPQHILDSLKQVQGDSIRGK
jgi:glycosyltransferase involved in cell wall biosynthesis